MYKYRGKRIDNGQWVYGYLCFVYVDGKNEHGFIFTNNASIYSQEDVRTYDVRLNTVGQFIGSLDENKKEIYEDDLIQSPCHGLIKVSFSKSRRGFYPFACGDGCGCCEQYTINPELILVNGNIHDNPELLYKVTTE
jgi:uncharacterized phage protein (TIGR01671 family)